MKHMRFSAIRNCERGLTEAMTLIIRNSKGNHFMEARLDRGRGDNNSFSSRVVEAVEDSSFRPVEVEDSNFLGGLAFRWEALSSCIAWSFRRPIRAWRSVPLPGTEDHSRFCSIESYESIIVSRFVLPPSQVMFCNSFFISKNYYLPLVLIVAEYFRRKLLNRPLFVYPPKKTYEINQFIKNIKEQEN